MSNIRPVKVWQYAVMAKGWAKTIMIKHAYIALNTTGLSIQYNKAP